MYELVFLTGIRAGEVIPVVKSLIAGRSPECSLEVPDPNTSRQHSRFVFDGASLSMVDNGSSNGTFVNEVRQPSVVLRHGDVVRMGETRIRVQQRKEGEANASSIFSFKEVEADLSHSILLDRANEPRGLDKPEVLAARLNALTKVSRVLVDINNLEKVLDSILDVLFEIFPQADRAFLLLGKEATKLEPKAVRHRDPSKIENMVVSTSLCRRALETRAAFQFNDQDMNGFDQGMSIVSLKIRSAMAIPLIVGDEIQGLLQIDTSDQGRTFTPSDLDIAVVLSQQAAIAVRNAQMLRDIKRDESIRNDLRRFLPSQLADQVLKGTLDISLGGRIYHGTVLFSDIVGFTRLSETLKPEQVVAMMNAYFDRMVPCIDQTDGAFDKFIGDAIMAYWGIPFDKGNSAANACQAALAMQQALIGFNNLRQKAGDIPLGIGLGLHTGEVVAGNIGSDDRRQYTLLGDAVNTAARIEHAACRGQVLVSQSTWSELKGRGYALRMAPLSVRNKSEALSVLSLRGLAVESGETLLNVPISIAGAHAHLIRRMSDNSFVVLHAPQQDLCAAPMQTTMGEWPDVILGKATMMSMLPAQGSDGDLVRSLITLDDPSLRGLLGETAQDSPRGWTELVR